MSDGVAEVVLTTCPVRGAACRNEKCEMWDVVSHEAHPPLAEQLAEREREYDSKSWWWRLWNDKIWFMVFRPTVRPKYGCALKHGGVSLLGSIEDQ